MRGIQFTYKGRELLNSEWTHQDSGASQGMDRTCWHRGPPSISSQALALHNPLPSGGHPHAIERLSENSEWLLPLSCQNGLLDLVTVGPHTAHAGRNPGKGGTGGGNQKQFRTMLVNQLPTMTLDGQDGKSAACSESPVITSRSSASTSPIPVISADSSTAKSRVCFKD